ncbi:MAG: hypothetical protein L0H93_11150, partial [Nocardioides sp.]|nr:hypothetical protein [Nocardioides sp.]
HRLAYPVLAYTMIAVLTSVIWDRFIWAPLALSLVVAARVRVTSSTPDSSPMQHDAAPHEDAPTRPPARQGAPT